MSRLDEFVRTLGQLPQAVWDGPITNGVGWHLMLPVSKSWQFGHFATLFTFLGLNCFQTKGKSDVGYWPKVGPFIHGKSEPATLEQLAAMIEPFYRRERFAESMKLPRLRRFFASDLCREIWGSNASDVAAQFARIWIDLGRTMGQQPEVKSIAFGARSLATALLMVGETRFDFSGVPIPVDLRIRSLPARLGQPIGDDIGERRRWKAVLDDIRKINPKVTMVHLDHLLWEIARLPQREIRSYLAELGAGDLASRIADLFGAVA